MANIDYSSIISTGLRTGGEAASALAAAKQRGSDEQTLEKLKNFLQGQTTESNLASAKALQNGIKPGEHKNIKVGDVDISEAQQNPLAIYLNADKAAYHQASEVYNQGQKGLGDELDAVSNISDALKRNDAGSLGQVRAGILASSGFKRYNDVEGYKAAPDTIKSNVNAVLQKYGLPTFEQDGQGAGVLNPTQIQNAAGFAQGKVQTIASRHQQLKQLTTQNYRGAPLANASRDVGQELGTPLDARLQQVSQSFGDVKQSPAAGQKPAPTGMNYDQWKQWKATQSQGQQQPAAPGAPQ